VPRRATHISDVVVYIDKAMVVSLKALGIPWTEIALCNWRATRRRRSGHHTPQGHISPDPFTIPPRSNAADFTPEAPATGVITE